MSTTQTSIKDVHHTNFHQRCPPQNFHLKRNLRVSRHSIAITMAPNTCLSDTLLSSNCQPYHAKGPIKLWECRKGPSQRVGIAPTVPSFYGRLKSWHSTIRRPCVPVPRFSTRSHKLIQLNIRKSIAKIVLVSE